MPPKYFGLPKTAESDFNPPFPPPKRAHIFFFKESNVFQKCFKLAS